MLFCSILPVGVIVRVIAVLGYPPALWFEDSLFYVRAALRPSPDRVRPVGYSFFLASLASFHSVWLVTAMQAVMGSSSSLAGIALAWRSLGGPALLLWLTGAVLIVTPAATAGYGARYLLASIPAFRIAGAIGVKEISHWLAGPASADDTLDRS
jgi:hypothetical protein